MPCYLLCQISYNTTSQAFAAHNFFCKRKAECFILHPLLNKKRKNKTKRSTVEAAKLSALHLSLSSAGSNERRKKNYCAVVKVWTSSTMDRALKSALSIVSNRALKSALSMKGGQLSD